MSRSGFLRSVYNFVTSAGVAAAGAIYLGKRHHEKHGSHHPYVQKFHNYIEPFAQDLFPSERVTKAELNELSNRLVYKNQANSSAHLNGLLLSCALSGIRPSDFVISILDDKVPIDDILGAIENNNELATSIVTLYDNPESSYNLAHIAAMSNRNLEEKARLIEFLQQKSVNIDAKSPIGETIYDICPVLFEVSFRRPETIISRSIQKNLNHESTKEGRSYPSI